MSKKVKELSAESRNELRSDSSWIAEYAGIVSERAKRIYEGRKEKNNCEYEDFKNDNYILNQAERNLNTKLLRASIIATKEKKNWELEEVVTVGDLDIAGAYTVENIEKQRTEKYKRLYVDATLVAGTAIEIHTKVELREFSRNTTLDEAIRRLAIILFEKIADMRRTKRSIAAAEILINKRRNDI